MQETAVDTVVVTEPEYKKAEETFAAETRFRVVAAADDESSMTEAVRKHGARAVIVGVVPYGPPLLDALASNTAESRQAGQESAALIARFGVGYDSVDLTGAAERGIVVTNTPGVLDQSVAEHTVWLLGALARTIPAADARVRQGEFFNPGGVELSGKTLGLIGLGRIGRRVAQAACFGLGMRVIAGDCLPVEELTQREGRPLEQMLEEFGLDDYTTDVDRVFAESDAVSLHLPAIPATHHFVDARRLALMQPHALLVNTARGMVLDESALFDALQSGRPAAAALDVFEQEPYVPVDPVKDLRTLPNVVLTPHTGSNTRESNRRMAATTLDDAAAFFGGELQRLNRVG